MKVNLMHSYAHEHSVKYHLQGIELQINEVKF